MTIRETTMQARLAQTRFGRIALHLLCAWRDHKYRWHWQGIRREVSWAGCHVLRNCHH